MSLFSLRMLEMLKMQYVVVMAMILMGIGYGLVHFCLHAVLVFGVKLVSYNLFYFLVGRIGTWRAWTLIVNRSL